MSLDVSISRRGFLKGGAMLGAGLVLAFHLPATLKRLQAAQAADAPAKEYPPDAFIRIAPDGTTTILCNKAEMGQGVYTSLPMLICEELEADWSQVRVEPAPAAIVYAHPVFGIQMTGGSTSVASSWEQMRRIGAVARTMLVETAAARWNVPAVDCRAENGFVLHGDRKLSFGELAEEAGRRTPPASVTLKNPKDFKLIGKATPRLEGPDKVSGKGQFGIDVRVPGMLFAVLARPPVFGGKPKQWDSAAAQAVPGVLAVKAVAGGVAVYASNTWAALKGREALKVQWDDGPNAGFSTAEQRAGFQKLAREPGTVAVAQGDAPGALKTAAKTLDAEYEVPYLAHACMEPLNCTVRVDADAVEIWAGTQFQTVDQGNAAKIAGVKPEQVTIHTTLLGGGFGRRANPASDWSNEAVEVAKAMPGKPVMTVWSREDDTRGGWYRPHWVSRLRAGLGADGLPVAWLHTIVGQSILAGTPFEAFMVRGGIDATSVEGASDLPYAVANLQVDLHSPKSPVPVQWWRSVGHSHTGFVVESFVDECAHAAGIDPLEYRRRLLAKHQDPRFLKCLNLAAAKAGWSRPPEKGSGRGIAIHESFESVVCEIAEVTQKDGRVQVTRVVAAVDCGTAVNPDMVRAQIESGIVYGLSAALYGQITLKDGRVEQGNFDDYPAVRLSESPQIEVHIVPSEAPPTGVGEPGTPPIAAAVGNALFALTGERHRRLPLMPVAKS